VAGVVKRSVSFPSEVFAAVEAEARKEGVAVSAVVTAAAEHWVSIRRGLRAVAEWEGEHGAFTEQELASADRELDAALKRAR
jgi:hypothetical protein